MAEPLQGTASAAGAIARVGYSHDAMIDLIIAIPDITQNSLAKHFGYTVPWVSRIMNSDAFLARLAARKMEIVDPSLVASVEEKLRALASKSLDVVIEKMSLPNPNTDHALKALEITSKALGYGARQQNLNVQQNFVVALPGKAEDAATWAATHRQALGGGSSMLTQPMADCSTGVGEILEGELVHVQSPG